jgi:hypothetical protein
MQTETRIVLRHHSCPEWGRLQQGVHVCRCDCGNVISVCTACFMAERVTSCRVCQPKQN